MNYSFELSLRLSVTSEYELCMFGYHLVGEIDVSSLGGRGADSKANEVAAVDLAWHEKQQALVGNHLQQRFAKCVASLHCFVGMFVFFLLNINNVSI